jgi:hypothetical protein
MWRKLRRQMETSRAAAMTVRSIRRKLSAVVKVSRAASVLPTEELAAETAAEYLYRPLDTDRREIRLLTLEPGRGEEVIRCTLSHAFIDRDPIPHYETVSYTCGDPTLRSEIMLHDHATDVLASSEVVLRRMRLPTAQRVLWVDSICIDQANTGERGHQVGMMYEIYANTSRNLIWLGPDDEHTGQAIIRIKAVLNEMAKRCNGIESLGMILGDKDAYEQFSETSLSLSHTNHEKSIAALVHFFDSPWFDRLWVVQEVSLAPESVCYRGKHEIPILDILRVAGLLNGYASGIQTQIGNASFMCRYVDREHGQYWLFEVFERRTTFLSLLVSFSDFKTVDPRDRIFALLGLWRQLSTSTNKSAWLNPDYSLRVCEVFLNATRYAITEGTGLGALLSVFEGDHDFGKWPSWVPRWDHEYVYETDASRLLPAFHPDDHVGMKLIKFVGHTASLCVHGLVLDVVAKVLPALTTKTTARRWREELAEIEAGIEALPCNESWIHAPIRNMEAKVASTLCAGGAVPSGVIDGQQILEDYRAYKQHLTAYQDFPNPSAADTATNQEGRAGRFRLNINVARNRSFFHTKDGHVGLGPLTTKPGDLLVILYGSSYPAILRPHEDENCFFFVGLAYVYGIMDGEAVREYKARGVEDTLFCIV